MSPTLRIAWREWLSRRIFPLLFVLSLVVSLSAYLVLDSLQSEINIYIENNQKEIAGGDILVESRAPFTQAIDARIEQLPAAQRASIQSFSAIARAQERTQLIRVKAVSAAYPLYGQLKLASGRSAEAAWPHGSVLVEDTLLLSLGIEPGARIHIGEAQFIVADVLNGEPDRPLSGFGFGSRVMMHSDDLDATGLLGQKSRVNYRWKIATPAVQQDALLNELRELAADDRVTVRSAAGGDNVINALSGNFLRFLKILVIAVIVLSGVGLMSVLRAFLNEQHDVIAIRRTLGESLRAVMNSYRLILLGTAVCAVALAWATASVFLAWSGDVFAAILPPDIELSVALLSVFRITVIAALTTLIVAGLSLHRLRAVKPVAVLHKHPMVTTDRPKLWVLIGAVGLAVLLYIELQNAWMSAQLFIAIALLWGVFRGLSSLLMRGLRSLAPRHWLTRLAVQNIFRKNNHSTLFMSTLSMTVMMLSLIVLLDHVMQKQLISSYPENAPNLFFLDIQAEQMSRVDELVGAPVKYYPVVRARIHSINGVTAAELKPQLGFGDDVTRVFNLSYGTELPDTENFIANVNAGELFEGDADTQPHPMSMLASAAEYMQVDLGDVFEFDVQGVRLSARITSIRKRKERGPSPFFYFIFPPSVLAEAPQIRFATTRVEDSRRAAVQTAVAREFPGITPIDATQIAARIKTFVDQLKVLIQLFTGLSLFAAGLIFAASLLSTSQDRLRESQYYRLMGMRRGDITRLSALEFNALGLLACVLGIASATAATALICHFWLNIEFVFPWGQALSALLGMAGLMCGVAWAYSRHIMAHRPVDFLRHQQ